MFYITTPILCRRQRLNKLEHSDLEPILEAHVGNTTFKECLQAIEDDAQFVRVLGRYVQFNSVFGGGVANLAGEIAVMQDLFRDSSESVPLLADRSVEVAADVFFAAVDEFDDRSTPYRDTHRTLAQATLKGAGKFYGFEGAELNKLIHPGEHKIDAIEHVKRGYGVGIAMEARDVFRAIGFHMGSEILADEEFTILDRYLRANRPDLVSYLQQNTTEINGEHHNGYFWVMIHTSVEADHFAFAAKGANRALQFYVGAEPQDETKSWLLDGFSAFADVQAAFMGSLVTSS